MSLSRGVCVTNMNSQLVANDATVQTDLTCKSSEFNTILSESHTAEIQHHYLNNMHRQRASTKCKQ